jgi:hypothetical protein
MFTLCCIIGENGLRLKFLSFSRLNLCGINTYLWIEKDVFVLGVSWVDKWKEEECVWECVLDDFWIRIYLPLILIGGYLES